MAIFPKMLLRIQEPIELLSQILTNFEGSLPLLLRRQDFTPGKVLRSLHLPLLALFAVAIPLSPFSYYLGWSGLKSIVLLSAFVLAASFLWTIVADRIAEADGPRRLESPENPLPRNIALYMHLPLASLGPFYILHPAIGLVLLLAGEFYCLYLSIEALALCHEITRARAIVYFLQALLFFLLPALGLAFLVAVGRTIAVLV